MKYALSLAFFMLGFHMLDAAKHYWNEDEPFSFSVNLSFGATSVLIGLVLLLHNII